MTTTTDQTKTERPLPKRSWQLEEERRASMTRWQLFCEGFDDGLPKLPTRIDWRGVGSMAVGFAWVALAFVLSAIATWLHFHGRVR